jgi:hypothetical protein
VKNGVIGRKREERRRRSALDDILLWITFKREENGARRFARRARDRFASKSLDYNRDREDQSARDTEIL